MAICVGAFANHANFVIIHDAIHNCVFASPLANKWTAILADLPNAFPTAMGFRCYHIKHHSHLSAYDYDADIPSRWEVEWVGNSAWRKAAWLFLFPAIQLARLSRLKGTVPILGTWTYINIAVVAVFDLFVLWAFGPNALLYLFFSFWFSVGGLHPLSARWLQEHFAFGPDQGTFDYYGPLNTLALNIGYHNEHHDFHEIPWNRLPELKAMAPEFYDDLRCHRSWVALLVTFIFDPTYSLGTRSENVTQAAGREAPIVAPAE
jgi:sphingolipid delta-4 desaturase